MESLIVGLVILALSGLSFLAYNHPAAYSKLVRPILVLSFCIFIAVILWDFGVYGFLTEYETYMSIEKRVEAYSHASSLSVGNFTLFYIYWGIFIYLLSITKIKQFLEYCMHNEKSAAENDKPKDQSTN